MSCGAPKDLSLPFGCMWWRLAVLISSATTHVRGCWFAFLFPECSIRCQAGQWARLYRQVQAAEARLHQAEQDTPPSQTSPPETAKQQAAPVSEGEAARSADETEVADERQAQLRIIAVDLIYWRDGLKVLHQAQLPKWRGLFKWQIEAKIEALQQEYAKLRAACAKPDE